MSEKFDIRRAVRDAEYGLTGRRFCTSCQSLRPAISGMMIEGKRNRWQCSDCTGKVISRNKHLLHKGEGDA